MICYISNHIDSILVLYRLYIGQLRRYMTVPDYWALADAIMAKIMMIIQTSAAFMSPPVAGVVASLGFSYLWQTRAAAWPTKCPPVASRWQKEIEIIQRSKLFEQFCILEGLTASKTALKDSPMIGADKDIALNPAFWEWS